MASYAVQVLRVLEGTVEAQDELQAEKAAVRELGLNGDEIAILVQSDDESGGGALKSESNVENWSYAKENFWSLDPEWVFDQH